MARNHHQSFVAWSFRNHWLKLRWLQFTGLLLSSAHFSSVRNLHGATHDCRKKLKLLNKYPKELALYRRYSVNPPWRWNYAFWLFFDNFGGCRISKLVCYQIWLVYILFCMVCSKFFFLLDCLCRWFWYLSEENVSISFIPHLRGRCFLAMTRVNDVPYLNSYLFNIQHHLNNVKLNSVEYNVSIVVLFQFAKPELLHHSDVKLRT